MRNSLVLLTSALLFLVLAGLSPAGAEELRPSSKHPAPADQSASPDELRILEELKAELAARLKKKTETEQAATQKKTTEQAAAEQTSTEQTTAEKAATEQAAPEASGEKPPPPPDKAAGAPEGDRPEPPQGKPAQPGQAEDPKQAQDKPEAESGPEKQPPKGSALGAAAASDEPIKITSNRLEADDKAMTVNFIGQVKAVQGETRLWCDKMVVHYTKEDGGADQDVGMGARKIRKIEVFGHVKVTKGDKVGTGQQGLFEFQEQRVVLWGKAHLSQGQNTINGDKVILYLNDDRAVVEGGPQKVEAVLVPTKEPPKNKPAKPEKPGKPGGQG